MEDFFFYINKEWLNRKFVYYGCAKKTFKVSKRYPPHLDRLVTHIILCLNLFHRNNKIVVMLKNIIEESGSVA